MLFGAFILLIQTPASKMCGLCSIISIYSSGKIIAKWVTCCISWWHVVSTTERCCSHCQWHTVTHTSTPRWRRPVTSAVHRAVLAGCSSVSTVQALWNCASTPAVQSCCVPERELRTDLWHFPSAAFVVRSQLFVPHHWHLLFHHRAFSVTCYRLLCVICRICFTVSGMI